MNVIKRMPFLFLGVLFSFGTIVFTGKINSDEYVQLFGYPVHFLRYHTFDSSPIKSIDLFRLENIKFIEFRVIDFLINSIIFAILVYVIFIVISKSKKTLRK